MSATEISLHNLTKDSEGKVVAVAAIVTVSSIDTEASIVTA